VIEYGNANDNKVKIIPGDLTLPNLGISESNYSFLLENLSSGIYHNGALVHWVFSYSKLKKANVDSVKECLKLISLAHARKGGNVEVVPFFFVSSTSVFDSQHYAQMNASVKEDDPLSYSHGLSVGYAQSKFVAEGICSLARKRGFFRPAYVLGDSRTGVTNTDDYLIRLLKGVIQVGSFPNMRNKITAAPVDFVAASIVHCSKLPSSYGLAFHFLNPDRNFRFSTMFQILHDIGYDHLKGEEYYDWQNSLKNLTLTSDNNALFPLLHFVLDDLPNKSKNPELTQENMGAALRGTDIICPSLATLLPRYIAFLIKAGFLPSPSSKKKLSNVLTDVVQADRLVSRTNI